MGGDNILELNELKNKFYNIKNQGWVKSKMNNSGSIGLTFEKLIGIENNELELPDFGQIEIKTKTAHNNCFTSLFCCTPTGPHYHEVERLKDVYGYPDAILKKFNVLNNSINSKSFTKIGNKYFFKLIVNRYKKKIFLCIFNINKKLLEDFVYWDFDVLEEKLYRKLKNLAYVKAYKKKIKNDIYFKYYSMKIYRLKNFETFINLLENGNINIVFKIGIFRDSKKSGKIHDHGTAFVIHEKDILKLYDFIKLYN